MPVIKSLRCPFIYKYNRYMRDATLDITTNEPVTHLSQVANLCTVRFNIQMYFFLPTGGIIVLFMNLRRTIISLFGSKCLVFIIEME